MQWSIKMVMGMEPMPREEIEKLQTENKLIEVYGVGLGFVCVKRGCLKKLKDLGLEWV